jgi:hypothetical protein
MRYLTAIAVAGALALALPAGSVAGTGNPSGTGPPSQSCQEITAAGGHAPGKSAESKGAPFNEPSETNKGGTGGLNYSEKSQYDVACFHVSA